MTKKFFTHVSPRAVEGIRRLYAPQGGVVRAKLQNDGSAIVVVMHDDADFAPAANGRQSRTAVNG